MSECSKNPHTSSPSDLLLSLENVPVREEETAQNLKKSPDCSELQTWMTGRSCWCVTLWSTECFVMGRTGLCELQKEMTPFEPDLIKFDSKITPVFFQHECVACTCTLLIITCSHVLCALGSHIFSEENSLKNSLKHSIAISATC